MKKYRMNPFSALFHLIINDVHKLEYDPKSQFEFHRKMSWFWIINLLAAIVVYFFANHLWQSISVFYLVLVSLYANFATDYGAMPSSHAAIKGDEISDLQKEETFEY
jgi:cell division protein FtsW (lipid II flippase)